MAEAPQPVDSVDTPRALTANQKECRRVYKSVLAVDSLQCDTVEREVEGALSASTAFATFAYYSIYSA